VGSTDFGVCTVFLVSLSLGACGFWGFDIDGGGTVSVVRAAVVSRWGVMAWSGSSALSLVLGGVRLGFWGGGG